MSLTRGEVDHIARLARLDLSDEEKERYQQQLSAILDYAEMLQRVDTSGIAPTSSVLPPRNVLREDTPQDGLSREALFGNTNDREADQFKVPPVLE
ncbi:MAG: Asp-tRNA(Asn)/Glu-tRNA(Gln) amidotransferase subunit GatC [Anaerolineaceae bacterium]|nr:Asp-tRNA(Asn)/Glu-tRNA(Gln) amidotransferase subunit GatC [Anaerolineaceae bacterium]